MFQSFLADFFMHLRNSSTHPLGIGEYLTLLQEIEKNGSLLDQPEELAEMTRLLWLKTPNRADREIFYKTFTTYYHQNLLHINRRRSALENAIFPEPPVKEQTEDPESEKPEPQENSPET